LSVVVSQKRVVPSAEPEKICLPSAVNIVVYTVLKCSDKVRISVPVERSQSFIIPSVDPEIIFLPSELNATDNTDSE